MTKLHLNEITANLTPTGYGSSVKAGDVDISKMVNRVEVCTTADTGTTLKLRLALVDCRVAGSGEILAPHPDSTELLPVAEIVFKDGRRWKVAK